MSSTDAQGTVTSTAEEDYPLFFGDWLKRRRKQLDLTQTELAQKAYCSVFALRKIEAGERRPSKQLAGMLAKTLEIPVEDHAAFIKVARGDLSVEKLVTFVTASPPAEKTSPIQDNLPRALTPFIGREPEITALVQLLQDPQCSLLTIVGPGGIGKTRLAVKAVHHSKQLFPDGLWFVPLASLNSPALIIPAIADAVGFKFQDSTDLQAQLIRYLRPKRALLVLDNAEHLLEGTRVYTEILTECQQIKLLVTSRERLNLLIEWVFEIQGLPVPPDDQVKQFNAFSSVALFIQSARRVQADFDLQEHNRQWILKICQIMEGMPLGIELSAAWVGLLSIKEIAIEIEHNLDFLSVSMRDLPERHHSVRATLDHSWRLLTPEEKLILSRLSVFHGNFSRKDAHSICGADLGVLSSLRNKSLLHRSDQEVYSLHEIIRQYAALKLAENPVESFRIKDEHALYFIQYLSDCEAALQGSRQIETFEEMGKVINNLSQAWQHMVTHCLPSTEKSKPFPADLLHGALFSLSLFYEMRCRSLEAITIFTESVAYLNTIQAEFEKTDEASYFNSVLGHVTAYLGLHHVYVDQYDTAVTHLETAINWLGDEQSRVERAQAMVMLSATRQSQGQFRLAAALCEQSREIFREAGEDWWYVLSCSSLATTYYSLGKLSESEELYQEASRLVKPGDLRLRIPLTVGFAYLLFLNNNFAEAEKLLQDALPLSNKLRDAYSTANILYYLGRVAFATHRVELAESYFRKSMNIQLEFGQTYNVAVAYLHLGNCSAARGDRVGAHEQFRQAIQIGQVLNQFHLVYYALVFTANTYMAEGQIDQALEIFLLLRRYPIEYKRMQEEFARLQANLQASLPEGQIEAAMQPMDGEVSLEKAKADVLAYVQEHKSG